MRGATQQELCGQLTVFLKSLTPERSGPVDDFGAEVAQYTYITYVVSKPKVRMIRGEWIEVTSKSALRR